MEVDPVGASQKLVSAQDPAKKNIRSAYAENEASPGAAPVEDHVSVTLKRSASTMGILESENERRNSLAVNIRETDRVLNDVSIAVGRMKVQLEMITKNFPPFPQDSDERRTLLMSYASLRKEILEMTVPPPPQEAYFQDKELWNRLAPSDTQGLAGYMHDLSETASDSDVKKALTGLDGVASAVAAGRKQLADLIS